MYRSHMFTCAFAISALTQFACDNGSSLDREAPEVALQRSPIDSPPTTDPVGPREGYVPRSEFDLHPSLYISTDNSRQAFHPRNCLTDKEVCNNTNHCYDSHGCQDNLELLCDSDLEAVECARYGCIFANGECGSRGDPCSAIDDDSLCGDTLGCDWNSSAGSCEEFACEALNQSECEDQFDNQIQYCAWTGDVCVNSRSCENLSDIDDYCEEPAHFDDPGVVLDSTTIPLDGHVEYTYSIVNNRTVPVDDILVQGFLNQNGQQIAAGGTFANCGDAVGRVPVGGCEGTFTLGTYLPGFSVGPATAEIILYTDGGYRLHGLEFEVDIVAGEANSCEAQDACGGFNSNGGCWCDSLCTHYGDCCSDGPC